MSLSAVCIVCTLKPSPQPSSSLKMADEITAELAQHDVQTEIIRAVDHAIHPGVSVDMGDGDEWPTVRKKILAADILVMVTPVWMGQASSIAQRVLERLDADLSIKDDKGRPDMFGKVAVVGVVGNEDGAHHIAANLFQALNDIGFSIPAQGSTYWIGAAMQSTDYKDLDSTPEETASTNKMVAKNAAHLASLLRQENFPA